jgi:hypothetical protein
LARFTKEKVKQTGGRMQFARNRHVLIGLAAAHGLRRRFKKYPWIAP